MAGHVLRAGTLHGLPAVMVAHGGDTARALTAVGLPSAALDDPEALLPYVAACRLLAHCAEVTSCPHFGLLVGAAAGPDAIGRLGYIMMNSPDVRTALLALQEHHRHHDQGGRPRLRVEADVALLSYDLADPDTPGAEHICDGAIALGTNLMRALCGPRWWPREVLLARRRPVALDAHGRVLGRRIRFDAEESALCFPVGELDIRPPTPQPALRALLLRDLDRQAPAEAGLDQAVRRAVQAALGGPGCNEAVVARLFGLAPRSLQRKLAARGTSFHALHEQVRQAESTRLLGDTDMALSTVALRLGYSELSAFVRAFRRWEGMPPARWRSARVQARR